MALPGARSWNNLSTCGQKWARMPREVLELEQAAQGSAGVALEVFRNGVDVALCLVGMVGFHLEDIGCLFGDALGNLELQK